MNENTFIIEGAGVTSKLYVGNIPYSVDGPELEDYFSGVGRVMNARVIMDRNTQRSKGFGFVEMDNPSLAEECIAKLNGTEFKGRKIIVSFAVQREASEIRGLRR